MFHATECVTWFAGADSTDLTWTSVTCDREIYLEGANLPSLQAPEAPYQVHTW